MIKDLFQHLKSIRRDLHKNYAERSGEEFRTAAQIRTYLQQHTNAQIISVANTGTIAVFESDIPGKTIMIRADIDALPISESNTFDHKSINAEVSHKCGHDGHTTILLGLARTLEEQPPEKGTVILLWQPAEENGMGAKAVIEDRKFQQYKIDETYALHNLPGFPLGQILYKSGAFTANVKSLIIDLKGKTTHAAEPEHGHNPAYTIARILGYAQELINNKPNEQNFYLITPVYLEAGSKDYGIASGAGSLHLTIRSWSPEIFAQQTQQLTDFVDHICQVQNVTATYSWTQEFWTNNNDEKAVAVIKKSADDLGFSKQELSAPFKWGEDFGLFTQSIPGAMFGIGAGEDCPALHNPDYDFPDEIIVPAARMFHQILTHAL